MAAGGRREGRWPSGDWRRTDPGGCRPTSPGWTGRPRPDLAGSELSQLELGAVTVPAHHPPVTLVTVEDLQT